MSKIIMYYPLIGLQLKYNNVVKIINSNEFDFMCRWLTRIARNKGISPILCKLQNEHII